MVKSADRILKILELISSSRDGYTHREIASALDIPKSSLTALLGNLCDTEYLTYEANTKRYLLGPQILLLAGRFLDSLDIVAIGQPYVKKLCLLTEESVALAIPSGNDVLFVCKENSNQPIMRSLEIGSRLPMYATAAGKAILAFMPEQTVAEYLDAAKLENITRDTITDREEIMIELEGIRQGMPAYSIKGFQEGVSAFGRPVFDNNARAVASLAVSAPSFRVDERKQKTIETHVIEIANELSHRLGYQGFARPIPVGLR